VTSTVTGESGPDDTGGGDSGTEEIPVAVDGEALRMTTPVVCTLRPGALRVVVPRHRPGVVAPAPRVDWRRLFDLAFGRPVPSPPGQDG
ncbi:diacylglycerol kinase, partial [Streptomyces sp. NPDC057020]